MYGSDAIAGVVNVIYKTNFEGVRFRGQAGETGDGDSARYGGGVMAGSSFHDGKGHFLMDISYDRDDGLYSRARSRSAIDQSILGGVLVKPTFSSYAPQGRFEYTSLTGDVDNVFTFNKNNTEKDGFDTTADGFNRNALRRLSVPTERTLLASTMNYDFTEHTQGYSEITYGFNHTLSDIEPFAMAGANVPGAVYGTAGDINGDLIAMPITNAYFQTLPSSAECATPSIRSTARVPIAPEPWRPIRPTTASTHINFRKRLSDIAVRSNEANRQTMRALLGVKGDIPIGDWKYDITYSYGRTTDSQLTTGQVNLPAVRAALDLVVVRLPAKSSAAMRFGSPWAACLSNLFGFNSITQAAADLVRANVTARCESRGAGHRGLRPRIGRDIAGRKSAVGGRRRAT